LQASEARYRNLFNSAVVSLWEEDYSEVCELIQDLKAEGITDFPKYFEEHPEIVIQAAAKVKILDINQETLRLFGAENKEEMLKSLDIIFLPETVEKFRDQLVAIAEGSPYFRTEFLMKSINGEPIHAIGALKIPTDTSKSNRVAVSVVDISDLKKAEAQIRTSLKEKEVLLQEIHHRVKNNMQVIIGLLKLQSDTVKDQAIMDALINSQMRIQSMAFVHETLYNTESLASIDFETYTTKLARTIFQSYGDSSGQVQLKIEAEDIKFGIDQATPLGLLINELVSNALKHAFPDNRSGEITIKLKKTDDDEIELFVGDTGIGLPEDFDWRNTDTLGFKLVNILAEGQLDGKINLERDDGTRFVIRFKLENNQ